MDKQTAIQIRIGFSVEKKVYTVDIQNAEVEQKKILGEIPT